MSPEPTDPARSLLTGGLVAPQPDRENGVMRSIADVAFGTEHVISRKTLKRYVKRTNYHGLSWLAGHSVILVATGLLIHLSLGTVYALVTIPAHGVVLAFLFSPVHECSHRTPFRTLWLNEFVYWILCLVYIVPPTFFRYSHAAHHTFTQIRGKDPDMVLPPRATVWHYAYYVTGIPFWLRNTRWLLQHALSYVHPSERYFLPAGQIPRVVFEARVILACYGSVAVVAIWLGTWVPLIYWLVPRLFGEPVMRWIRIAEHAECAEGGDLTENTRTTRAARWLRFLFWNMPYHAEHHLCPMVPFHALPELHAEIGEQVRCRGQGYLEVHADVLRKLANHEGVTWTEHVPATAR